ncbi:unnamed protein product [Agarophyton chilense]|eukprot:gb/GEZJ01002195.1/.p1 GENE.gb/GEZJ01002195.1/~~gb/GEZJ01002195.1/.p1  ORF type:complete len:1014 (+),score=201.56 gb/GEZJ01002195.1/:158-3199(+)
MSVSTQRSTKGVLRNLNKLTDALLEENSRLQYALHQARTQIETLHVRLELLRRDVAARDRYDGEVRDHVAAIIGDIQSHYKPLLGNSSLFHDPKSASPVRSALEDIHAEDEHLPSHTDTQRPSPPLSTQDHVASAEAELLPSDTDVQHPSPSLSTHDNAAAAEVELLPSDTDVQHPSPSLSTHDNVAASEAGLLPSDTDVQHPSPSLSTHDNVAASEAGLFPSDSNVQRSSPPLTTHENVAAAEAELLPSDTDVQSFSPPLTTHENVAAAEAELLPSDTDVQSFSPPLATHENVAAAEAELLPSDTDVQRSLPPLTTRENEAAVEAELLPSDTDAQHPSPPLSNDENMVAVDAPIPDHEDAAQQSAEQIQEQSRELTAEQTVEQAAQDNKARQTVHIVTERVIETRETTVLAPQDMAHNSDSEHPFEPQQAERDLHSDEGSAHELHESVPQGHVPGEPELVRSADIEHEHLMAHVEGEPSGSEHIAERSPDEEYEPRFSEGRPEPHEEEFQKDTESTHEEIHSEEERDQPYDGANFEGTRSIPVADTGGHLERISDQEESEVNEEALDVSRIPAVLVPEPSEVSQEHTQLESAPLASLMDPTLISRHQTGETEGIEHEPSADHSVQFDEGGHGEEAYEIVHATTGQVNRVSTSSRAISEESGDQNYSGDTSGHEEQDLDEHGARLEQELGKHETSPAAQIVHTNPYKSPAEPVPSSSQPPLTALFSLPFAADVRPKPGDSPHEVAKKLYEASGHKFESCSSVFRVIRKKRRSPSAVGEEEEDDEQNIEFVTLRPQTAEVLPWKAREGSEYIDVTNGALAVKPLAAVASRFGTASLNANLRVLEPLRMPACRKDFCYISPEYPDGTSLPYVPVNNVILQHQPPHWDEEAYGINKVRLSFQKHVFEQVKEIAIRAYQDKYPGANVSCACRVTPKRVRKVVQMDADAKVDVSTFFERPMRLGIPEVLSLIELDIVGLVLLYIGVDAKNNDGSEAELAFRLHSMVMKRVVNKKRPDK